jgi:hypothetical protein
MLRVSYSQQAVLNNNQIKAAVENAVKMAAAEGIVAAATDLKSVAAMTTAVTTAMAMAMVMVTAVTVTAVRTTATVTVGAATATAAEKTTIN